MTNRSFQVAGAALLAATPVLAQSTPTNALEKITVTASRAPVSADEVLSELIVIDRDDLDKLQGRSLIEVLARLGGLQFAGNGGRGKIASVFTRGTEARHTLLLIDGVRFGSATTGTPAWENIALDTVERIEILKGSGSSLHGADAAGGVVQIFTRAGSGQALAQAKVELGGLGLRAVSAQVRGAVGGLGYSVGASSFAEAGASATNTQAPFGSHNPDADPFKQQAVFARLNWQVSPLWQLTAGINRSQGSSAFDDGAVPDARARLVTQSARLALRGQWTASRRSEFMFGESTDTNEAIQSAFMPSRFTTTQRQVTWQNTVATPLGQALFGAEHLSQSVDSSTRYAIASRGINAVFAGLNGQSGVHRWQANVRRDQNSQFGAGHTGFLGYGVALQSGWGLNASHGTSFVAPSFNQLYFPGFGNPQLQPERGQNTDLSVKFKQGEHAAKLIRFDHHIRGFIASNALAVNVPKARIKGWTLGYDGVIGGLDVRANVDRLDPRNELTGRQLPRRSPSTVSLSVDQSRAQWSWGASLLKVGNRFDDVANTLTVNGYTTLDVRAGMALSKEWALQGRINNFTNRTYASVFGYNEPARQWVLGLNWRAK